MQTKDEMILSKSQKMKWNGAQQMTGIISFVGLCVGIGVGFLRHLHVTKDFVIDIICADYVINTTLAAIRLTANKYEALKKVPEPEVYNVTSKGFYLTSGKLVTFFLRFVYAYSLPCPLSFLFFFSCLSNLCHNIFKRNTHFFLFSFRLFFLNSKVG